MTQQLSWIERLTTNQKARGSNPFWVTKLKLTRTCEFFYLSKYDLQSLQRLSVKCWGIHPTSLLWHQSYVWLVPFFLLKSGIRTLNLPKWRSPQLICFNTLILLLVLSVYPLEYGSKKALVNCFIHAGNDVKKLLNSFNPDAFTNFNQCIKCAAIPCLPQVEKIFSKDSFKEYAFRKLSEIQAYRTKSVCRTIITLVNRLSIKCWGVQPTSLLWHQPYI